MLRNKKIKPLVSICIPVFGTEGFLRKCLDSVESQNFPVEIIVVDDFSNKTDERGFDSKKIVKEFSKKSANIVKFYKNSKNLGIVETRRKAVYNSTTDYIFFLDSDDLLLPNAIQTLYKKAISSEAQIVDSNARIFSEIIADLENSSRAIQIQNKIFNYSKFSESAELFDSQIQENWLIKNQHTNFLWQKLFSKNLCIKAFEQIPFTFCILGEDLLIYFFISFYAKKYSAIKDTICSYNIDSGVTSAKKITDLKNWEKVCSVSSVFTIIFDFINSQSDFSAEIRNSLRSKCVFYIKNNLEQLNFSIPDELKNSALQIMYDFWGKDLVTKVIEENKNII